MILVTGGCGFIGTNLVLALLGTGYEVRVLDDFSIGKPENISSYPVQLIKGDVCNPEVVAQSLKGVSIVIHLAAQTGVNKSIIDPVGDFKINIMGTFNMLKASHDAGVQRFIFASSNAVLGSSEIPVNETRLPQPISPYGASKLACEGYCSAFYHSFGLTTTVLRFSNVYGPFSSFKESVVARFVKELLATQSITIYGNGHQTRDFIYVSDLCAAIKKILDAPGVGGQIFQIASGVETEIIQLAHQIVNILGIDHADLNFLPERVGEMYRNYANIEKAKKLLNWTPSIALDDGLRRTCRWFLENMKGGKDNV